MLQKAMFRKKNICSRCEGKLKDSYSFCPYCGSDLRNPERDMDDFGKLGRNDVVGYPITGGLGGIGITDKMINSVIRNLVKNLDMHMKEVDADVESLPNGVKIKFGMSTERKKKKQNKRVITQEQLNRMSKLPRVEVKSDVRRFSDKVVYDLKMPGIENVNDVFVSKLETGYEVKAIGKKKVFVNSIPVNLPLKGYSINEKGLIIEFGLE